MLVEEAVVMQVEEGWVGVEKVQLPACSGCSQTACSSQTISGAFSNKTVQMRLQSVLPLQVGDRVLLGLEENSLIKGALAIYLLPLVALIAFAWLGQFLFLSEPVSAAMGIAGFILAFYILKKFKLLSGNSLQPIILQKLD